MATCPTSCGSTLMRSMRHHSASEYCSARLVRMIGSGIASFHHFHGTGLAIVYPPRGDVVGMLRLAWHGLGQGRRGKGARVAPFLFFGGRTTGRPAGHGGA